MTLTIPTTLPEALIELEMVRAELERWHAFASQKIQEKNALADALRSINPEHPLLKS